MWIMLADTPISDAPTVRHAHFGAESWRGQSRTKSHRVRRAWDRIDLLCTYWPAGMGVGVGGGRGGGAVTPVSLGAGQGLNWDREVPSDEATANKSDRS